MRRARGLLGSPALTAARRASFGLPLRRDGRSFPVVAGLHVEAAFCGVCRVAVSFVLIACDNYRVHDGLDVQWNFRCDSGKKKEKRKKANELRAVVFVFATACTTATRREFSEHVTTRFGARVSHRPRLGTRCVRFESTLRRFYLDLDYLNLKHRTTAGAVGARGANIDIRKGASHIHTSVSVVEDVHTYRARLAHRAIVCKNLLG